MPILDRYFTEISAKPEFYSITSLYIFGYFDSKEELCSILCNAGSRMQGMKDLHVRVSDTKEKKIIEDMHFPVHKQKKKGSSNGELFDFSNEEDAKLFINKYFDINESGHGHHQQYFAEFRLEQHEKNSVILAYFSCVNEFYHILEEVGKKVKEDGTFSFTVDHVNRGLKKLVSKVYKMYRDGSIFVPEMTPHLVNFKEKDLKHYALSLWESEFND